MIGRIYRPKKIHTTPNRRGVAIEGQYKSHFGKKGTYELAFNFVFNKTTREEYIALTCTTDGIDWRSNCPEGTAFIVEESNMILRKIYLPQDITTQQTLRLHMPIRSLADDYSDGLSVTVSIVREGTEEALVIEAKTDSGHRVTAIT